MIDLIRALSDIPGVSGWETPVRKEILRRIEGHCASAEVDALGNLIVFKKGAKTPKNKLLFSAHMDEVGYVVTMIEESGLLRFAPVGSIDARIVVGKAVEIGPTRLPGVIGGKALHHQSEKERDEVPAFDKLYIDIGATSREEAKAHVSPGDRAVFAGEFLALGEELILGRAFDDRAGCALLIRMIESDLPCDCYFAFTVQEETGCSGGTTAGYLVAPYIGVAVETTTAADIAGALPAEEVARLGEGPVVSFMDRGTVYDSDLYRLAFEMAKKENIPCQTKTVVAGGNESRAVQTAGKGARVMAVSVPCRYLHTASCVLHKKDIENTGRLLFSLVGALSEA